MWLTKLIWCLLYLRFNFALLFTSLAVLNLKDVTLSLMNKRLSDVNNCCLINDVVWRIIQLSLWADFHSVTLELISGNFKKLLSDSDHFQFLFRLRFLSRIPNSAREQVWKRAHTCNLNRKNNFLMIELIKRILRCECFSCWERLNKSLTDSSFLSVSAACVCAVVSC